jgi:transketolase
MAAEPTASLDGRSIALRRDIVRVLEAAGRGHVAPAFSLVEMLHVLYDDILRFDPAHPDWHDRDRCILSKGHGCLALYVMLADKGFFPKFELLSFCRDGSDFGGHPEAGLVPGVEASTGALGHGLSIGVGQALAARMQGRASRVFVITGDGELGEGAVWEAALAASKYALDNLVVLVDANGQQSYGATKDVLGLEPLADKWRAFGFGVLEVDGHDCAALGAALKSYPFEAAKPSVLICRTVKGKGVPFVEGDLAWHHKSRLGADDARALFAALEAA